MIYLAKRRLQSQVMSAASGHRLAGQATQAPAGVSRAYQFLNQMMDSSAIGTVPRLVQSYTGGVLGTENYTASSIYDDALVIDAYLAERTADGRARAQAIGTALLSALAQAAPQGGGLYDELRAGPALSPGRRPAGQRQPHDRRRGVGRERPAPAVRGDPGPVVPERRGEHGRLDPGELSRHPRARRLYRRLRGDRDRTPVEVDRAEHRRVRVLQPAGPGERAGRLGGPGRHGEDVHRLDVGPGRGPVQPGHAGRRCDHERQSPDRGRQQLVLPRAAVPRLRRVGRLGRAEPGLGRGAAARGQYLPRRPDGRLVRGHRPSRRRPGDPRPAGRFRPGRGLPGRHRLRAGSRPERGRSRHHGRVQGRAHRLRG